MEKQRNEYDPGIKSTPINRKSPIEGLTEKDFQVLLKRIKKLTSRDEKNFMDMLLITSRNHYTLNQMVDRKARILLSGNVLFLTLIIGRNITMTDEFDWIFWLSVFFGFTCLVSIVFSMMAVIPEKKHGSLNEQSMVEKRAIPLFFGNFIDIPEADFENMILKFANNREVIYRSMIQDIFHLGKVLERKRRYLRTSLGVFILGLCLSLLLSFVWRLLLPGL